MLKRQAFKFLLKPNGQQERSMRQFAGACRYVYNRALARQKENYEQGNKYIPYVQMTSWLIEWKYDSETPWLKEAPAQPLQQALKNLEKAFKNFFEKRAQHPKFKKKGFSDSFTYPQGIKLEQDNKRIFLPKLGWMRLRLSRQVIGEIKNVTVSLKAGKWYVSIQTETEVEKPIHSSTSIIGLDVGVSKLATLSDGTIYKPVNSFKTHQRKLVRLQRQFSRKVKFSNNWRKLKLKIQRLYSRIANIRKDYLHKLTTEISKNHAMIVVEGLKIRNMSKSAKGTVVNPGRNVKAKSGLNRAILDQGWFELFRQLIYKQGWCGGDVLMVNPAYTSQTCSACGAVSRENRKSQARFNCVYCGHKDNADVNAARNILAAGHAAIACGGITQLGCPMKQEPAEVLCAQ